MIAGLLLDEKELTSAINGVKIFRKMELMLESLNEVGVGFKQN
jgi:hypothetical protein